MPGTHFSHAEHPWLARAQSVGRSVLRAWRRVEDFETTSHCAAMPRIPHRS